VDTQPALFAVTVLGDDRPGIVADVTGALAGLGCNLEDSTMTLLRGHFAMVVLVRTDHPLDDVTAALAPLSSQQRLTVDVRPLPDHDVPASGGRAYTLHVHGADRPGLVAAMTRVLLAHGGNIVDLCSRLGETTYTLHVHGADRPGLVAAMTRVVLAHGGNIVDLCSRLGETTYTLVADLVLPDGESLGAVESLEEELSAVARELGVDFHLSAADDDLL
jgi:glycine cleavage system transcriptional repressor